LVADELVLEAKRVIQDTGIAEDDRVVERSAEGEAALSQHLDFLQEAEGARRRNVLDKTLLGDPHRSRLMPQQWMIEADAVGHLEVIRRVERNALVSVGQRDRPQHFQVAPRSLQAFDASLVD